jgi:hypothetical protein
MKKQTIILLGILFFTFLGYSQIKYNVTLGINSSRFSDEFNTIGGEYLNTSSIGLSLGVSADLLLSDKISFYPKIIYNQMGDREKNYDGDWLGLDRIDYKLDYISIPLNFKFFKKPYILFGPQIGFLVSQKAESLNFGKINNTIDFGGNIGIGLPIKDFRIELILYQSLTDVMEIETNRYGNEKYNLRNTYINFNISYLLFK